MMRYILPLATALLLAPAAPAPLMAQAVKAQKESATLPFAVITLKPETTRSEQIWDGVVEAVNEATMSAQTSGRVLEIPFDVNDYVPEGSLIIKLTDVEQQAALRQAQATYSAAQSNYDRIAQLYSRQTVAKAAMDNARERRDTAEAALRTAQQQLDYTEIKAPYAGYVTKRFVQVGEEVRPGEPLISGISLNALRIAVQIPQTAAAAVRKYNAADVILDQATGKRVSAAKVTVFPFADPQTHSFNVRLELPEVDTGLYPGMTVKCAFEVGEASKLLVPASALVQRSEVSGVYVVNGDQVGLRQLRLGHRYGDRVEVLAGLSGGEQIAADPIAAALYVAQHHAKPGKGSGS
jgi:RND family efflux transporter MFP subunit